MNAIYQLKADEPDQAFLDAIKAAFKDKEIELTVSERAKPPASYVLRQIASVSWAPSPTLKSRRTLSLLTRSSFSETCRVSPDSFRRL